MDDVRLGSGGRQRRAGRMRGRGGWSRAILFLALAAGTAWAAAGDLDQDYGIGGFAMTGDLAWLSPMVQMVGQSDGGVVGGGSPINGPWELRRFDANGAADLGFGSGGVANVFTSADQANLQALAVTSGDGILAGGCANVTTVTGKKRHPTVTTKSVGAVARLTAAGSLDTSFGTDGVAHLDVPGSLNARVNSLLVLSDGKILAAGQAGAPPPGKNYASYPEIFVARLDSDGALDTSFATNGYWVYDPNNQKTGGAANDDRANRNALAVLADGSIVVAAHTGGTQTTQLSRLILLSADGSPLDELTRAGLVPGAVAVDDDDRILVSDLTQTNGGNMLVRRFTVDSGTLAADDTFGTDGEVAVAIDGYDRFDAYASLALAPTGEIVVAGYAWNYAAGGTIADAYAVRLTDTGELDDTFGQDGVAGPLQVLPYNQAFGCLVDAAGETYVGGLSHTAARDDTTTDWVWFVARLTAE